MNDRYRLNYSEDQIKQWVFKNPHLSSWQKRNYNKNTVNLCEQVNMVTPKEIFTNISKLIMDEGVEPKDLDVYVVTASGDEHLLSLGLETIYQDVYTNPLSA